MSGRRVIDPDLMRTLVGSVPAFASHHDDLLRLLTRTGAVLDHHFVLQSGAHSRFFLRFADIVRRPEDASAIASLFAGVVPDGSVLLCPETSGVALAAALWNDLKRDLAIVGVDKQRRPTSEIKRGSVRGKKTYVVNDVVTTGASLERLAAVAREQGGELAGVIAFAAHKSAQLDALAAFANVDIQIPLVCNWAIHSAAACPLCSTSSLGPAIPAVELN